MVDVPKILLKGAALRRKLPVVVDRYIKKGAHTYDHALNHA